jgi:hypothetical protein
MLKGKLLLVCLAIILVSLVSAPFARAAPDVSIYGYTDKTQYRPGETVMLKFWILNNGPEGIFLKNVTLQYPWYSPLWGGNNTIEYGTTTGLENGQNRSESDSFTIPTDGRAALVGSLRIRVYYQVGSFVTYEEQTLPLNVASVQVPAILQDMDKVTTLFTVLVVLLLVCTGIIGAAIFLSTRRPQVQWKAEQKTE